MSTNVSVIYCSIRNDPEFPGVNKNNPLFYSQIYILGKVQWKKKIMFVSQGVPRVAQLLQIGIT